MLKHKLMVLGVTALVALLAGCATAPPAVETAAPKAASCWAGWWSAW